MGERDRFGHLIACCLLVGMLGACLLAAAAPRAEARSLAGRANKGVSPSAVPKWAKHKAVHLLPAAPGASRTAGERVSRREEGPRFAEKGGVLLGPDSRLEQRENTDRPLLYREGSGVQHEPHVYVIFWGYKWNQSGPSVLRTQLLNMYKGLSGSAFQGILTQYFDGTGRISSTVAVSSYVDTEVAAPTGVDDAKLQQEVQAAITANGWSGNFDAQFVVIPAPETSYDPEFGHNFCGYHGLTEKGNDSYTFVPYIGDEPFYSNCIGYGSSASDVTSMVAAHEYAESATDPALDTWYSEQGFEIADVCATHDYQVSSGPLSGSWVQPLWDQSEATCLLEHLKPPHVYAVTEPGGNSGWRELRLRGVVNPEGADTHYHFEYGKTLTYGNNVPAPDLHVGSGSANVPVGATLSGMPQGIYHYRLVATNGTGTVDGEDRVAVSPGFAPEYLPQPPDSGLGQEAHGISCVQVDNCMAVGSRWSLEVHTRVPQASFWDGKSWTPMTTPVPPGLEEGWSHERHAVFHAISCTSVDFCLAVGNYKGPSEVVEPFAEAWDGTEWSQPVPTPADDAGGRLRGVSCTSSTQCTAVGYFENGSRAEESLVEHWNGTGLTWMEAPSPVGAAAVWLESVSCTSSSACTAAGTVENGAGGEATLAERWNGSEWTIQDTLNPSGAQAWNWLESVSCASSSDCMAVGTHFEKIGSRFTGSPLTERWNGSGWSLEPSQNPLPNDSSFLTGVSCVSPSSCTAVGSYSNLSNSDSWPEPFAERWNGSSWSMLGMPDLPVPPESWHERWMDAVSCAEATACVGVGNELSAPFGGLAPYRAFSENEFVAPFASFVVGTEAPASGSPVDFDATSSESPGGSIESYEWDFGDGSIGSGPTPSHTYAHGGEYTVTLTVTDSKGRSDTVSHPVDVAGLPPTAAFSILTASPFASEPVSFDGSASSDPDGPISAYEWDFGDGSSGSGPTPSHTYAHGGEYTVTLTVTDGEGETGQVSHSVEVGEPPIVEPPPPPHIVEPPYIVEPPEAIVYGYRLRPRRHLVTFRFGSATPGVQFRCELDSRPFVPCVSPEIYRHLSPGRHTFTVVATDAAGNQDPAPPVIHFRVPRVKEPLRHKR